MRISSLSTDNLRLICEYLSLKDIGSLYASNDRLLMRRLTSPGVCSRIHCMSSISPNVMRFILDNASIEEFSSYIGAVAAKTLTEFELTANDHISFSLMPPRLLLNLPSSLKSLTIKAGLLHDHTLPAPSRTFASLFPNLRTLAIRGDASPAGMVDTHMDQFLKALPPKLETLALLSHRSIPQINTLPASLTSLSVTNPTALCKLAEYPTQYPTFEFIIRLGQLTPLLVELSVPLSGAFGFQPPTLSSSAPTHEIAQHSEKLLPHLSTLNIFSSSDPNLTEVVQIVTALPLVESFLFSATGIIIGISEEDYSALGRPTPPVPIFGGYQPLPLPVAPGFGAQLPHHSLNNYIDFLLPMHLTRLTLAAAATGDHEMGLSRSFFLNLLPALVSLKLHDCRVSWSANCSNEWFPFMVQMSEPGDGENWASLLPRGLTELETLKMPFKISALPSNLVSIVVLPDKVDNRPALSLDPTRDFRGLFRWPPSLTRLDTGSRLFSKGETFCLPPTLTSLKCTFTQGWTQESIKALLEHLPNAQVIANESYFVYITDPVESSPEQLQSELASLVSSEGHFSLSDLVALRLSDVPRRINASWSLSSSTGASGPLNLPPLSIPLSVKSIEYMASSMIPFSHGRIRLWLEHLTTRGALLPSLERIVPDTASSPNSMELNSFSAKYFSTDLHLLPALTLLDLPDASLGDNVGFADFPRSLTSISLAGPPLLNSSDPYKFEDWAKIHRPTRLLQSPGPGFMLASPHAPYAPLVPTQGKMIPSDLPKGLIRLDVPQMLIPLAHANSDWPTGLTSLQFTSSDWTDESLLTLSYRIPSLNSIKVFGMVLSYGAQPPRTTALPPSTDASVNAHRTYSVGPIASLDHINVSTLAKDISAPLNARGIVVRHLSIPSPFVFASASTHSITLTTQSMPEFKVINHDSPYSSAFNPAFTQTPEEVPPNDCIISFVDLDFNMASLSSHKSLTSFINSISLLSWAQVSQLPQTLRHLSTTLSDKFVQQDPFHLCPRSLITLRIDSKAPIWLTASGLAHLPSQLSTLEINQLGFNPSLISDFPSQIKTILFESNNIWSDVDVWLFKQHIGDDILKLAPGRCTLSGALLSFDSTPNMNVQSMIAGTNAILGPSVHARWYTLATPLCFGALEISTKSSYLAENTGFLPSAVDVKPCASILSLDLHLALIRDLRSSLPVFSMPPMLTSLSYRSAAAISPHDASTLPRTLKHFSQQISSQFTKINPFVWPLLPRALETIVIDFIGHTDQMPQQLRAGAIPTLYSVSEPAIIKVNPTTVPELATPTRYEPQFICELSGLPSTHLRLLSLRPFILTIAAWQALGSNLRTLLCAEVEHRAQFIVQIKEKNPSLEFTFVSGAPASITSPLPQLQPQITSISLGHEQPLPRNQQNSHRLQICNYNFASL